MMWEQTDLENFGGGGAGGWDTNVHPWKALWRKVKRPSFAMPFCTNTDQFTKTGSGQT
jgi:hypothetical protein